MEHHPSESNHRGGTAADRPHGTLLLAGDPGDPARCRRLVQRELERDVDQRELDDIVLVVSELTANGVLHATTPLIFRLRAPPECVVVTVEDRDECVGFGPVQTHEWSTQGRGLSIVDRLADRWGITPLPGGKVVWAIFDREPSASAGPDEPCPQSTVAHPQEEACPPPRKTYPER